MKNRLLKNILLFLALVLGMTSISVVSYASWSRDEVKNPVGASATVTPTPEKPICYNSNTNVVYCDLAKALNVATSGQTIYMFIGTEYDCSTNLTIKSGVQLVLPFYGKENLSDETEPIYELEDPAILFDNPDEDYTYDNRYGKGQGDISTKISTYRKCLLNMRDGADITINSGGRLSVGGVYFTTGNYGFYTEINLGSGSCIDCSGTLDCYGYIKEDYTDAINPIKNSSAVINNTIDSGRYIRINNGGTLNSYMAMYDALSGGTLANCISDKKYCPFWSYDFSAMQTYTEFVYGSSFQVKAVLKVGNNYGVGAGTVISSGSAMFKSASGSIAFEYCPSSANAARYTTSATKTNMIFNGTNTLASLTITVMSYTINTSNFFLPISYKQIIYIPSGSTMNVTSKVKFLNESVLHVNSGATFNITNQVIFYSKQAVTLSGATKYTHNSTDALLDLNGTLVVSGSGKIGARIKHSNQENSNSSNKGCVDLSSASSSALSVTANEDGNNNVTVKTSGLFIVDDANHSEGTINGEYSVTKTYYSGYDSSFDSEEQYYWIGEFVSNVEIAVTIQDTSYRFPFKYYTLKSNTTASNSNATTVANNASTTQTYSIQGGLYINFSAPNVANVSMTINGNTQTYNASSWFKVTSGAEIVVTPSQGFKVRLDTTGTTNRYHNGTKFVDGATDVDLGTTDNTDSGRGSTTVKILASTSPSSSFSEVAGDKDAGFAETILASNQYYRLYCSTKGTNGSLKTIEFTGKYYDYNVITGTGSVMTGFDLGSTSDRDSHTFTASDCEWRVFTFGFKGGSGGICLAEGTMITMADGSYKDVKDIRVGDNVMVFNHETGKFDSSIITINDHLDVGYEQRNVLYLVFSNGKTIKIIGEHGFIDTLDKKYHYIDELNYSDFIGHNFYTYDRYSMVTDNNVGTATLVNGYVVNEMVNYFSPASYFHLNIIAEDFISMPGAINGLFNIFELDDSLKYDDELKQKDIEEFGLLTYEEAQLIAPGISEELFYAYPAIYYKVAVGKGLITWEEIMRLTRKYTDYE